MRVVLVSGIFPPDIGGPSTHTDDLRQELGERGHAVTVVTLWDGPCISRRPGILRIPRRWSWPMRHAAVASWLVRHRHRYDSVYATGMLPAAVAGARLAGRPVVVKVVGDPVWERGRRLGLTGQEFERFQDAPAGGGRLGAMRRLRDWSLRRSSAITAPSEYLSRTIEMWLGGPADVTVIPNGVRVSAENTPAGPRDEGPLRAIYVGRLVAHKQVGLVIAAVAATPGVRLEVVGSGPELERLQGTVRERGVSDRVTFRGDLSHEQVLRAIGDADVLVLASDYEGLPHVVLEALAEGTPVVSPSVGGVGEVVEDGISGLVISDTSVSTLSDALARLRHDPELLRRLTEGARRRGAGWTMTATAARVEDLLTDVRHTRPTIVMLGKARWPEPTPRQEVEKLRILVSRARTTLVRTGRPGIRYCGRTRTILLPADGAVANPLLYGVGSLLAVGLTVARRRAAVMCQSPFEGFGVAVIRRALPRAWRPRLVVDVHGDWRTAVDGYGGGRLRAALGPAADAAARWALREADTVRVVSGYTEHLARQAGVRGPVERFVAFEDSRSLLVTPPVPPPTSRRAMYLGSLEPAKGIDVLLAGWKEVRRRLPDATLVVAGDGSMRAEVDLDAEGLGLIVLGAIPHHEVGRLLDESSFLVVPSRSEGLGRVVLEAFARGRPVVGTAAGGIPEIVADGRTGRLVDPGDPQGLADAIVAAFEDTGGTAAMGARARALAETRDPADSFEAGFARLAAWVGNR
jgi:glycosyltransferase involved in cell wall biosynthesis